jgi:hydrogenase maturation protease
MINQKYNFLIIGLGNLIMSDDGLGIHAIRELQKENWQKDILLLEVGTSTLYYLEEISRAENLIVIDAIQGGEKAGSIYRLTEEDLMSSRNILRDFHGCSLLNVIELSREITRLPKNLIIYGIEPENLNLGEKLSQKVQNSFQRLIEILIKEINKIVTSVASK